MVCRMGCCVCHCGSMARYKGGEGMPVKGGGGSELLIPRTGLIAEYLGDSFLDTSGSGNNLTNTGLSITSGKIGSAMQSTAQGQYATAGADITTGNDHTIAFWYNPATFPVNGFWLADRTDVANSCMILSQATGQLSFVANGYKGRGTVTYTIGAWNFALWSIKGDNGFQIGTDGVPIGLSGLTAAGVTLRRLFRRQDGLQTQDMTGMIDSFRVWNRQLTLMEAAAVYNFGRGQ